ncbi:MAG: hypothetical protein ACEPO0_19215 [Yoonia sp.]
MANVAIAQGRSSLLYMEENAVGPRFGEIILAQAAPDTFFSVENPDDVVAPPEDIKPEDLELLRLVTEFLADPEAFILDPENSDIVAEVVSETILRDPLALDGIIVAVDRVADVNLIGAVANGINLAAAELARSGDTIAASQILAKVALAPSTALRDAVQSSDILARDERLFPEQLEGTLLESETLEEPTAEAPPLAAEPGVSSDSDLNGSSNGDIPQSSSPTDTTDVPLTTTPPVSADPASPA